MDSDYELPQRSGGDGAGSGDSAGQADVPVGFSGLKMAIVHEWLESRAGSEKVFEHFASYFPDADLYALSANPGVEFNIDRPISFTWLQKHKALRERRQLALPLMPLAWSRLDTPEYDLVLTSSHAFSRYFPATSGIHLSYVHTPLRYAWTPQIDGRGASKLLAPARLLLRAADRRTVARVTDFAANSTETAQRINRFYGRSSRVIFPPVNVEHFRPSNSMARQEFLLGFSRWIPYKRLDLVIAVAEYLGLPAVIAGRGPLAEELGRLAKEATVPVDLIQNPADDELRDLFQSAACLVFPAVEDFGIVPLEAQACGTPVAAVAAGGSLDTVVDGITGALAPTQTIEDLADAVLRCLQLDTKSPDRYREHALAFSESRFETNIRGWVYEAAARGFNDSNLNT